MERVLDIYKRPLDPRHPVVCMDESPRQLISETRTPIPCLPGQPARYDYEYRRCGTCNIFLASEPLAGKRIVEVTERRTRQDLAQFLKVIADVNGGILFPKSGGIVFPTWPHNPIHIIREACEQRVPASAVLSVGSCHP